MNYPAASRRGIKWSCLEIMDFRCNSLIGCSKLRGITPIAIKPPLKHVQWEAPIPCLLFLLR